MLRVSPATIPACGRVVAGGPNGLAIERVAAPDGFPVEPGSPSRLVRGAPFPAEQAVIVARGTLAVTVADAVARSIRLPTLAVAFDRRPPGLERVAGAALANAAALLRPDDWSAVVLPSLGDLATGPSSGGQVALRADGLQVAAVGADGVSVHDLAADGAVVDTIAGEYGGVAFDAGGRVLVGSGAAVGPPGTAPADGSPVVQLASAALVERALARHADGTLSVWDTAAGVALARFPSPVEGPANVGLSADGSLVCIGTPWVDSPAAAVLRAATGGIVHYVEGAKTIATSPLDEAVLIGGSWGMGWIAPVETEGVSA